MSVNWSHRPFSSLEGAASAEAKSDAAGAEQELAATHTYPTQIVSILLFFSLLVPYFVFVFILRSLFCFHGPS